MSHPLAPARPSDTGLRGRLPRYALYLTGCVVFASGATMFIHSGLGVDPSTSSPWGSRNMCR